MPIKKLKEFLDENEISYETISHSTAYTAQEIASLTHIKGIELAKTVMVKIDGGLAMAVLPASYQVDLALLKEAAGAKTVELATEAEFRSRFPECEVGAMPPFGPLYGMPVYVDESLTQDKSIAFSAGSHHELIRLFVDDFLRLVRPKIVTIGPAVPAASRL
ncbi:MAG TPA: YbaK/EbsC family protein [Bryobacteraceae bacterium]|nr:YbaK/EbsC family protein [Bryobacteraceae bacterium]